MSDFYKTFRPLAHSIAGLVATVFISGCTLMPAYERPAAPVPAQWPGASPSASGAPARQELAWRSFFTDPVLQELIQIALEHNRDLRVARLGIEQARAQLGIRRADQLPTVNAALTGARTPASNGSINSAYSAGLAITAYELDFFGRVASLKEQALAQYLATQQAAQAAHISLSSTVAQTWLALLADEALLTTARQTLAAREDSLKLVELKARHGAASDLDLRTAQTLQESARVSLAQLQRQRALDENALALLLGQPLPAQALAQLNAAGLDGLTRQTFATLPAGLPSDLLAQRPDIRQAEQALIAANANIGAARAAFFPRISLTTGIGSASNDLSALFKDGSWGWTLSPQLLLPIFDSGRNQSALDAAQTARDIAVAQYEKAIQSAFREVADALATRQTLTQQLQATQALLAAESERARLVQLRLDNGAASQLDTLDAQRSLFAAQQALVQTELAVRQNQIALYKALGGSADLAQISVSK